MLSFLLVIIYISFISLGLPDAILGSAWPTMYRELQVPISYAGIISMTITGGTIISSMNSGRVIHKFGTGKVTAISVAMTAMALWGFSAANSFLMLCLWAIPYGLGAGSVDAALNNFVALHYKAKHMSWLHSFWGIGATLGPYIMGYYLTMGMKWNAGYFTIAMLQIILTAALIISLPLWRKKDGAKEEEVKENRTLRLKELVQIQGAKPALAAFFAYCALEATTGLWGSSYMVMVRGMSAEIAAKWISLFYFGITFGRFINGFIAMKLADKSMIRIGQGIAAIGVLVLLLPIGNYGLIAGFILIGVGCAPIYPSMLHATPSNFGKELSQAIMGMQMAVAYMGLTIMPPLFGLIAQKMDIGLYPFYLMLFVVGMTAMSERLNQINKKKSQAKQSDEN
ncbi:MAG: major facilitator superfamily 1 [Lachnospiraceae bacterium]|jgi:fucose permease|nr:major facilitator superfamily 1 [Lachnospiraceae bacterium]